MPLPTYNANALLTKTRRAAWDAIDNWQPLTDWVTNTGITLWKLRLEDDLNEVMSKGGTFYELPSITIYPGDVSEAFEVHRMAKFADRLVIDIKTSYLDQAEELSEMVWQAVWQSAPVSTPTVSYIKAATNGRYPTVLSIMRNYAKLTDGDKSQLAWNFSMAIGLVEAQDVLSTVLQARTAS